MLQNKNHGFTIVEVLVIAPIVILALGAFIAVMVNMTAEVLRTQSENGMVQSTQDALNSIEQDIKLSGQFLAANELTAQTPQGYADGTGPINDGSNANSFANVYPTGNAKGKMLILRTFTTDKNPIDGTRQPVYTDQPTASCAQKTVNKLFSSNTIYFVKNGTLWKRTIIQQGSGRPNLCDTPWQQPSCSSTVSKGAFCEVNDTRLADNVSDFTIDYFTNPGDTTPIADAVDSTKTITQRNDALSSASTARITITTSNTIAGKAVGNTAAVRATKLNITSDPPVVVTLGFIQQPTDQSVIPADGSTTFSAAANISSSTYQWQVSTNGGTSWANVTNGANYSGATTGTLTVSNFTTSWNGTAYTGWNGYKYRVVATNYGDTATSNAATLNVSNWGNITYLNNYQDYTGGGGYSTIGYTKTSAGVVMLKGLVEKTTAVVSGDIIGILPDGYRPTGILIFETSTSSNVPSRVDIYPDGSIRANIANQSWLSLEGINFIPATTSYTRTNLTPNATAGWANYGGSFAPASYVVDSVGRVNVQGLIRNGTMTNGTQMVTGLPSFPAKYQHVVAKNGGTFGFIGLDQTNGILAKGVGTNSYHSINTIYYPASATGWQTPTLNAGWVTYDNGAFFATHQYIKGPDNMVRFKGIIKSGTTTNGTVLFTLPAGYRPKERTLTTSVCADAYCRIDILPNGNVELHLSSAVWTTLDSVVFLAEQ